MPLRPIVRASAFVLSEIAAPLELLVDLTRTRPLAFLELAESTNQMRDNEAIGLEPAFVFAELSITEKVVLVRSEAPELDRAKTELRY